MTAIAKTTYPFLFDIVRDWMHDEFQESDYNFNKAMGVNLRFHIEWSQCRNGLAGLPSDESAEYALEELGRDATKLYLPDEMGGKEFAHARAYIGTQLIAALADNCDQWTPNHCAQHLEELAAIVPVISYWITHG